MPKSPKLTFPQGSHQGFPSSYLDGIKGSDFTPIRELLQNGLDAAVDKGAPKAIIRFAVKEYRLSDIPGIDDYRKHFESAVKDQTRACNNVLPDVAKNIVEPIRRCLKLKTCDVLCVSDNGIGLNKKSMSALLSTALGGKGARSTGAFGLGHLSAFSLSNLNYILYGGVSESGRICAGHASLASCKDSGKDGYYVSKCRNDLFNPYDFIQGKKIPAVISDELDIIEKRWGSGSVVIIPGFNYFLRKAEELGGIIFKIAALNFFVAIHDECLVIEFIEKDTTRQLGKNELASVLEKYKGESRGNTSGLITGARAYDAYKTLTLGESITVKTDIGDVNVMYRDEVDSGRSTRVELCRNGMHITDRIPNFQNKFTDLKPFHCLIKAGGDKFAKAVRRAEDHTHSKLQSKLISDSNEKKRFNDALKVIVGWLRKHTSPMSTDFYEMKDVFVVNSSGIGKGGDGVGLRGSVTKMNPRPPSAPKKTPGTPGPGKNPKGGKKFTFNRSGSLLPLRALVVPMPNKCLSVTVAPDPRNKNGEVRFVVDKHIDSGDYSYVRIGKAHVGGKPVPEEALSKDEAGNTYGILLGKVLDLQNEDSSFSIEVAYNLPKKYSSFDNEDGFLVFRTEMISRKITS